MRWVETNGGPFILLPWEKRQLWEGAEPPSNGRVVRAKFRWDGQKIATDYDEACDAACWIGAIRRKEFKALAVHMYPKTWMPRPGGGILVHWESGLNEAHVEAILKKTFGPRVRRDNVKWKSTRLRVEVSGSKLALFDAAYPGREAPRDRRLVIPLRRGTYSLSEADFRPDSETSLTLYRLTRRT